MATLHIEHPITDFGVWLEAFQRFEARRRAGGVVGERISRPVDDTAYVVVDLDFASVEQAERFRDFLRAEVWADPASSPALSGSPRAEVLVRA